MARPNTLRGTYVDILLAPAATPTVFTLLCGITTKSITEQVNTQDSFVRDCALPDDVPIRELILSGKQWSMRGSGQMNRDLMPVLDEAVGALLNYRFFIKAKTGEVAPALNGYYGGVGAIVTKTINGDDGGFVGLDLAIESDGAWTWTPVTIV